MYDKLQLIAVLAKGPKSQAFHSYPQISYMQKYVGKIHCLRSLPIANTGHTHTYAQRRLCSTNVSSGALRQQAGL